MNHLGNPWTYHFYGSVIVDEDLEIDGVLYGDHIEANSIQARTDDITISSRNNNSSLLISDTGYVSINNEYDLPIADGTANQVLKTDGLGNTSFATLNSSYISDFELDKLTDVVITGTPADNQLLIYSTGQWRNTNSPFLRLDGTANMTGALNMGGFTITNVGDVDGIDVSALDASVVKLTGNQTITGAKNFSTNRLRVSGNTAPTSGAGIELAYDSDSKAGILTSIDRDTITYKPFIFGGDSFYFGGGSGDVFTISNTEVKSLKPLNMGGQSITNVNLVDGVDVSALDSSVVKLTGDQTIAGNKIFTTYVGIKDSNPLNTGRLFFNYNANSGAIYSAEQDGATGYPLSIVGSSIGLASTTGGGITLSGNVLNFNGTTAISGLPAPFYDGDASTKAYTDTKLAKDGTTAMTGGLNMGGFAITNVGNVDGVDVSTLDTSVVKLTGDQTIAGTKTFSNIINASAGIDMKSQSITNVNLVDGVDVSALDSSVVKLTGDQTIAGNKKFTSTLEVSGSSNPASFDGIGIAFDTKIGAIIAQKTATASYYPIQITGSYVDLYAGNTLIATATGTTLSLNNNKITNLATPSATTDGANKSYVDTKDGQNVKLTGNQTIAGIKTFSSGLEITGNSTNATTKGTFVVFNSTANIGTIGCLDMGTGVNYNFEINAKKISFIIDGAIVGWVNASGLDCNSSKIANLGTPTLSTDGATKGYVDTLDGQNVKLTGDQTITGIKIFNGSRNDIRGMTLLNQADFNNVDIINGGNITYNGARILNQNGGDIFFSQTTGDYQYFLYTLNTASSGTANQRGYVFTNVAFDVVKGAGLYISKLLDNKSASSDIVRFNNAGGMKFYGALDMNSNNITSGGTITGTTITGTAISASDKITTSIGKPIIIGKATKGVGATGGLEIYGTTGDAAGAHFQTITSEDAYPTFQLFNWAHNDINLSFDAYFDGANFKSSSATSNFLIQKGTKLGFYYKSGITAGSNITWSEAMNISTAGLLTTNAGISTTTLATSDKITTALGKPIIIGRTTKGIGATGGLELYGPAGVDNPAILQGPHIQAFTATDIYPIFQILNAAHNNINLAFDAYYDGNNIWKSSHATSNFMINKGTDLNFLYKSGIAQGTGFTFDTAMTISTAGLITANAGITYSGVLTTTTGNGAKIGIQGNVDGTNARGIFLWSTNDSNWGIYMATSTGTNSSLSGSGSAPAGNGFSAHAIRFRVNNNSTQGFVWENGSNTALMSLRGSDGFLWSKGAFQVDGGITYTGVLTTTTLTSGAKIGIQGATDGGTTRGIYMWETANTAWGIYMATSGANKSLKGGTAPAGGVGGGISSYAIRFRSSTGSTEGFIWENWNDTALMSLRASDGQLWVLSNPIQYSDRRKKEDIKECLGLDFINKLNPVCYRMIDDKKKCRTGLIAQELEEVLEEMDMLDFGGFIKETIMVPCPKQRKEYELKGVSINPEDVKCVDSGDVGYGIGYSEFIAPLIKAVQQLSEKVVNLEKQNNNLMLIIEDISKQLAEIRLEVFSNVQQ